MESWEMKLTEASNWMQLAEHVTLSEDVIRKFADIVPWTLISKHQNLRETFITEFADKIDWHVLWMNTHLKCWTEDFLRNHINYFTPEDLTKTINERYSEPHCQVSEAFLDEFYKKIDFYHLSSSYVLSQSFIRKYLNKRKFNWHRLSASFTKKDEAFIEEYADKVNWWELNTAVLSREFCLKHFDRFSEPQTWTIPYKNANEMINCIGIKNINWLDFSERQILSEALIRKYADYVDWNMISTFQTLSLKFIEEFADQINWEIISRTQRLTEEFVQNHADQVDWLAIIKHQHFSFEFFWKNRKYCWEPVKTYQTTYVEPNTQFQQKINSKPYFRTFINSLIKSMTYTSRHEPENLCWM